MYPPRLPLPASDPSLEGDLVGVLSGADPDSPVHLLLDHLVDQLRVARASVVVLATPRHRLRVDHERVAAGVDPTSGYTDGIPSRLFRWLSEALAGGAAVCVDDVEDLPSAALAETAFLSARGTTAFMAVPLGHDAVERGGVVLLESVVGPRPWFESEVSTARRVARLLGRELRREQTEMGLLRSEERYQAVLELAGLYAWEWLPGAPRIHLSDGLLRLLDWQGPDNLRCATQWMRRIHPDDRHLPWRPGTDGAPGTGRPASWVRPLRLRDGGGSWQTLEERGRRFGPQDGPPGCLVGVLRPLSP